MKSLHSVACVCCFFAALLATTPAASAQAVPPPPAALPADAAPVQLSVFEVTAEKDLGYAASAALIGTRTNEKLENLPNSISVMTQDFLQDIAVNDFLDAVDFGTNAENLYNASGTRGAEPNSARSGNQISFRGLTSIRQLRDGFPWYMPQDMYNTERIEFSRGPGGLSYGDVDPGGIINISTKRAHWERKTSAQVRYDSFGTRRYSIDYNQPWLEHGLAVRLNAINAVNGSVRQRAGSELKGYAGAVRWEPFKDHRTSFDLTYEYGDKVDGLGHVPLNDQTATYVRGTGTNALDANLNLAGIQTNGVGMQRTLAPTSVAHVFSLIDGQLYNLQSSATAVFRNSIVVTGANVATGLDPQNPNRVPVQPFPESIVPRYEDWGGPDNTVSSKFHAYTLEFKHAFSDRISLLLAHNAQKDDAFTISPFNKAAGLGANSHAVFIDVNPNLPDPQDPTRTRLIPNPRFEQYFVNLSPITLISGHDMQNWRGLFVVDPELPWGITQRVVLSAGYRHEAFYADAFNRSLSREEILRRGYTAKEALYPNNEMFYFHYLNDGNGEAALRNPPLPGVTTDYRSTIGGGNKRFDQSLTSGSANMVGSYFKGAVHTSLGLSRDHWIQSSAAPLQVDAATGEQRFVDTAGNLIPNRDLAKVDVPLIPFSNQWVTNQSYGGVWRALSWVSLTAGYFESALFSDNFGIDLNGGALAPQTGEGHDYSVRFHPWGDRISANFTYFETVSKNNSAKISTDARDELNLLISKPFVNTTDYRDRTSTGYEVEIVTNVTRQWTLRGAYGRNRTIDTRFFPLLEAKISEARATAKAKGLNPDDATQISRELLASQEDAAQGTNRSTAALTTRYSFVDGMLKGAAVGGSVRYIQGQARGGVTVGGVQLLPDTQTESSYVVSPFVSYRRRIGRVSWTAQVNVNNVFDKVTEQGISYSFPRYTNPRQIITTVSMAF